MKQEIKITVETKVTVTDKSQKQDNIGPYGDGVSYNQPEKATPRIGHIGPYGDGVSFEDR